MKSIKRQAASKATQNKQQQGDSIGSLSAVEKLSCDFRVPVIIVKVHSAYSLIFMHMSGPEGLSSSKKDCVMSQNVLVAYGEKDNACRYNLRNIHINYRPQHRHLKPRERHQ